MYVGIRKIGDRATIRHVTQFSKPEGQVGLFYGAGGLMSRVFDAYAGKNWPMVYVDLGYWKRKDGRRGNRFEGYHKLVVNGRHPNAYFQKLPHPFDRAAQLGLQILPWTRGPNIVVVAMGPKGAQYEGFGVLQWEREAIAQLRAATDRPIVYRPKPNWDRAQPIREAELYSPPSELVDAQFPSAWAIVSHHSNANIEGLLAGVPSFTLGGAALPLSSKALAKIERPVYPDDDVRRQWMADLAYTQWSIAEMTSGAAWRHLKDEGLVP